MNVGPRHAMVLPLAARFLLCRLKYGSAGYKVISLKHVFCSLFSAKGPESSPVLEVIDNILPFVPRVGIELLHIGAEYV
ncbi:hypothetical protein DFJ58DRAFT_777804 [Suillus subalutaceus]|uniref:uncharacterized protein n=1 Tax=Suillus subalutaceus TaxID=48586 RepID=UPI001B85D07F|nr:uncharacterized protein DFJ58DRAFT_777804 [Suillus subalutaceus]KAG1861138.1 hypothetical protein DFJ58DRAFT_777804 [Suillus subalutaceus]